MADDMVTGLIRQYLRNLREAGIHATSGVLFGSFARGNARDWSDIDLVVVSPRFDLPYELADVETLWVVAGRTDSRIQPIPCGGHQWLEDNGSEIIERARREGRRIALEEAV